MYGLIHIKNQGICAIPKKRTCAFVMLHNSLRRFSNEFPKSPSPWMIYMKVGNYIPNSWFVDSKKC